MGARSAPGGLALTVAAAILAAAAASAGGAVRSALLVLTPPVPTYKYPGGERQRLLYAQMNQLAEELRQEVNRTSPDPAVVADLKARLRALAHRL